LLLVYSLLLLLDFPKLLPDSAILGLHRTSFALSAGGRRLLGAGGTHEQDHGREHQGG
jgi:hypothetical protein